MNMRPLLGLFALGLVTAAACGDDEGTGGSAPSTGGAGGTGQGGDGEGGGTAGGGGEGGTTTLTLDGAPCVADAECASGFCATEPDNGWPSGYCTGVCELGSGTCPGGGFCTDVGNGDGTGLCFDLCSQPSECRHGYDCFDPGVGSTICAPACTTNDQCPTVGYCDLDNGLCIAPELVCDDGLDDDEDGDVDCEDADCATTCDPLIMAGCDAALAAQPTNAGDTVAGTNLFAGSCTGSGAREQVYAYTPGAAGEVGTLSIVLQSATDQGVYVRTACADGATQLDCRDIEVGGIDELLEVVVNGGEPISIFVDAYVPGEEGPFTLNVAFEAAICGDGTLTAPELCDDANTDPGDGCAPDCTPEFAFYCMNAPVAQLGDNAGDTSTGTGYFGGTCTGLTAVTLENIFQYTPPADGTLSLVLASATDQGLYVMTDCADLLSELGCSDANAGGTNETLDVQVTGGAPVYIFVDGFLTADHAGPYTLSVAFTP